MDFRQILKAFTDVRHQLNRMEAKQDRMENKNEAVNELAEVYREMPRRNSKYSVYQKILFCSRRRLSSPRRLQQF